MTFQESIKTCFNKFASSNGRASLSEYWWFILFYIATYSLLSIVIAVILPLKVMWLMWVIVILFLGLLVPVISSGARRMHDSNKSGWWQLVPFYNLYLLVVSGDKEDNRFGPPPSN